MSDSEIQQKGKCSDLDGKAPDSTDFANYFCTYGYIYHQVRLFPASAWMSRH
jgi:hypothetical protein